MFKIKWHPGVLSYSENMIGCDPDNIVKIQKYIMFQEQLWLATTTMSSALIRLEYFKAKTIGWKQFTSKSAEGY